VFDHDQAGNIEQFAQVLTCWVGRRPERVAPEVLKPKLHLKLFPFLDIASIRELFKSLVETADRAPHLYHSLSARPDNFWVSLLAPLLARKASNDLLDSVELLSTSFIEVFSRNTSSLGLCQALVEADSTTLESVAKVALGASEASQKQQGISAEFLLKLLAACCGHNPEVLLPCTREASSFTAISARVWSVLQPIIPHLCHNIIAANSAVPQGSTRGFGSSRLMLVQMLTDLVGLKAVETLQKIPSEIWSILIRWYFGFSYVELEAPATSVCLFNSFASHMHATDLSIFITISLLD
jgi:hypothetical protein